MRKKNRGVTLIELMTVVAIVAMLASIAYSSYRNSVIRANRTEATTALLQAAAAQEKFYLQNNTYADDDQLVLAPADGGLGLARTTPSGYYTIAVTDEDDLAAGFQVTATPVDGGGQTDDDDCTSFTIDQTGRKGATGTDDAAVRCWR